MDGWMGGWMDGWMDGWVDGWMDGWVGARLTSNWILHPTALVADNCTWHLPLIDYAPYLSSYYLHLPRTFPEFLPFVPVFQIRVYQTKQMTVSGMRYESSGIDIRAFLSAAPFANTYILLGPPRLDSNEALQNGSHCSLEDSILHMQSVFASLKCEGLSVIAACVTHTIIYCRSDLLWIPRPHTSVEFGDLATPSPFENYRR